MVWFLMPYAALLGEQHLSTMKKNSILTEGNYKGVRNGNKEAPLDNLMANDQIVINIMNLYLVDDDETILSPFDYTIIVYVIQNTPQKKNLKVER